MPHTPQDSATIAATRVEVQALRNESAEVRGIVAGVDGHLGRLQKQVDGMNSELNGKLDALLEIRHRSEDHTAKIQLLASDVKELGDNAKKGISVAARVGLLYLGAITGGGAVLGLLRILKVI